MPIRIKDKPDKPTTTTTTTPAPKPQPAGTLGAPTGTIPTTLAIAYGRGAPWADVNRHDAFHVKYGTRYGVAPAMTKAMEVIESGGQSIPNGNGFPNFGVMQLTHSWNGGPETKWERVCKKLGLDFKSPEGQIATAAYVLGGHDGDTGTPEQIFLNHYYPIPGGLDVKGPDGHTQRQYLSDMHELMRIIDAAANGTTPAVTTTPAPVPQGDVIDLLFGGKPYTISAEYGQLVTWSCPGCYDYFPAYGLDTRHHWAYDLSAAAGDGAPLYAPFNGLVVCAGTGVGSGAWNTGCAAFDRVNNYGGIAAGAGHGRLEILNEAGTASLIVGHALTSLVGVGTWVKRGQMIGRQGGMNGSHVHLEGRYDSGRRIGDPRKLFGGGPITVTPERIPYDWLNDPNTFTVKALRDIQVHQRADPASPVLDSIAAGETFTAVAMIPGNDQKLWWLGIHNGRVSVDGTERIT